MVMERLLSVLVALPFLVGIAAATQPVPLNDTQMDLLTAGAGNTFTYAPAPVTGGPISGGVFLFNLTETDVSNTSTVMINIDPTECKNCYLNIQNESFTIQAQFGPLPHK
jgi:hypothetical protein